MRNKELIKAKESIYKTLSNVIESLGNDIYVHSEEYEGRTYVEEDYKDSLKKAINESTKIFSEENFSLDEAMEYMSNNAICTLAEYSTDKDLIYYLSLNTKSEEILKHLLKNDDISPDMMYSIFLRTTNKREIAKIIADNPNIELRNATQIIEQGDYETICKVLQNEALAFSQLNILYEKPEIQSHINLYDTSFIINKNTSTELVKKIFDNSDNKAILSDFIFTYKPYEVFRSLIDYCVESRHNITYAAKYMSRDEIAKVLSDPYVRIMLNRSEVESMLEIAEMGRERETVLSIDRELNGEDKMHAFPTVRQGELPPIGNPLESIKAAKEISSKDSISNDKEKIIDELSGFNRL